MPKQRHEKELMCILAAILMPSANGKVTNALNLAEGLIEEADKRWPDEPETSKYREYDPEAEDRARDAALAAQRQGNPDGGQQ